MVFVKTLQRLIGIITIIYILLNIYLHQKQDPVSEKDTQS
jgi:hypothetical protein